MTIRVIVNGAKGRMGQVSCSAVAADQRFELVAECSTKDKLEKIIKASRADVVVDFTRPDCVFNNVESILAAGAHPVVGTSGLSVAQIVSLTKQCDELKRGAIIAPNFSMGAILMMKFSQMAAQHFNHAEIIEMHHENKLDAPSGTAIKTAELIATTIEKAAVTVDAKETVPGARGANVNDINIHSVRMPGLVAHQMVMFGGQGETLTLRHDSITRESFMPGVLFACEKVMQLDSLIYGLENLL